jgi:metal-responsive CopG/Arc/MetJ family transcriptional regulator
MKVKTSITLSEEVLQAVDELAMKAGGRSQVIETALRDFLARRKRATRDARDLALLNRDADALNAEMADILEYQAEP